MSEEARVITVTPGRDQALRERAQACLGVASVLGLVGLGVGASGRHAVLAALMGLGCVAFLAAFGIVWDMRTARPDGPRVDGRTLALTLGPQVGVVVVAFLSLFGIVDPLLAVAVLFLVTCWTGMARTSVARQAR